MKYYINKTPAPHISMPPFCIEQEAEAGNPLGWKSGPEAHSRVSLLPKEFISWKDCTEGLQKQPCLFQTLDVRCKEKIIDDMRLTLEEQERTQSEQDQILQATLAESERCKAGKPQWRMMCIIPSAPLHKC